MTETLPATLQAISDDPGEARIRGYATEVFDGDAALAETWLNERLPILGHAKLAALLASGEPGKMRSVLDVLIRIDYGVIE